MKTDHIPDPGKKGGDPSDCEQPVVSIDPYDVNRNGEWDYCYKVKLAIGHQSFLLDYEGDTREEAENYGRMLKSALAKISGWGTGGNGPHPVKGVNCDINGNPIIC